MKSITHIEPEFTHPRDEEINHIKYNTVKCTSKSERPRPLVNVQFINPTIIIMD